MVAIACAMMKHEIELAMKNTGYRGDIRWLESGLHSNPNVLRDACQREIDGCPAGETCLLLYGQCGNGTVGLTCSCAKLVIPRFTDCIRMALSLEKGMYNEADRRTMYASAGWNDSERSIRADYDLCLAKYGAAKTEKVFSKMLCQYERYCMMDTGAYDIGAYAQCAEQTARLIGLKYCTCEAGVRVYEKILREDFDEEFLVKKHGEVVSMDDFLTVK